MNTSTLKGRHNASHLLQLDTDKQSLGHVLASDYFIQYKSSSQIQAALQSLRVRKGKQSGAPLLSHPDYKAVLQMILGYEKNKQNATDLEFMHQYLSLFPLFQEVDLRQMDDIVQKTIMLNCEYLPLPSGHLVFEASQPDLYLLISGQCTVLPQLHRSKKRRGINLTKQQGKALRDQSQGKTDQKTHGNTAREERESPPMVLSPGDYYGLLHPAVEEKYERKNKRLFPPEGCEFIRIPHQIVRVIVAKHFALKQAETFAFFQKTSLFSGVASKSLLQLVLNARRLSVGYKQVIYEPGDPALSLFFIIRGSVLMNSLSSPQIVISQHQYFGYQDIVRETPRQIQVICNANDTLLFQVDYQNILPILVSLGRQDVLWQQSLLYENYKGQLEAPRKDKQDKKDKKEKKEIPFQDKQLMQKQKIEKILRENKRVLVVKKKGMGVKSQEAQPVSNFQLTEYMMKQTKIAHEQTKMMKIKTRKMEKETNLDLLQRRGSPKMKDCSSPSFHLSKRVASLKTHLGMGSTPLRDDLFYLSSNKQLYQQHTTSRTPNLTKMISQNSLLEHQDTVKTQNYISSFTQHIVEQKVRLLQSQQKDKGLLIVNNFFSPRPQKHSSPKTYQIKRTQSSHHGRNPISLNKRLLTQQD